MDTAKSSALAAIPTDEDRPCFACYEGVVYIGHLVPLPDGDEEEVYTAYGCRLCGGGSPGRIPSGERS